MFLVLTVLLLIFQDELEKELEELEQEELDKELLDIGPTADELPEPPKTDMPKIPASTSKTKSSMCKCHLVLFYVL